MKRFFLSIYLFFMTFSLSLSASIPESTNSEKEKLNKHVDDKSNQSETEQTQAGNEEAEKTLKIGILAFPPSQQPNGMVSFGQNILNKKQAQAFLLANEFKGDDEYFINLVPSILYGFTDSLSLFISAPIAVRYRQDDYHSSGPGDVSIQLEYAFYTKSYKTYFDQATVVTNVTIPTGSTKKNPPTGIGSNSFFIGGTYSRTGIDWYYFASSGGILTTSSHRTQFGDQFLYQFGVGRRIANTKEWLFAWIVEFDGTYSWKDKIHGVIDPNSGGNVIYLTPSLWVSSENLIFQLGIGCPVQQHLFGHQRKNDYLLELNAGWTF
jgi:hypothetical protein